MVNVLRTPDVPAETWTDHDPRPIRSSHPWRPAMTAPAEPAGCDPHATAHTGTLPHQPQPDAVPSLAVEPPAECRHRWRIAPPNGSTSPGVCTQCGAQQQFPNSID